MNKDPAHQQTDSILEDIEDRVTVEYGQAAREIQAKYEKHYSDMAVKQKKWQEWVKSGKKTQREYDQWLTNQLTVGARWEKLRDSLATDLTNADKIARSITTGYAPEVYALNHDYGTYEIEKGAGIDTSYTLYSREAAERLFRDNPDLLPEPSGDTAQDIADGKMQRWNAQKIQSVAIQAILQGNSIPDIASRLANTVGDSNRKAAVRNARTMMTGVQNAGRIDAYKRGQELGIKSQKQWLATLDMRTRHAHRQLDRVKVDLDKPFQNEFGKIMYPGDMKAEDPANLYNCRCTLAAVVKGWESMADQYRDTKKIDAEGLTYEEWRESHLEKTKPLKEAPESDLGVDYTGPKPKSQEEKKTFADKIKAIKEKIAKKGGTIEESDLHEAGKVLATEFKEHKTKQKETYEEARRKLQELEDLSQKALDEGNIEEFDRLNQTINWDELAKKRDEAEDAYLGTARDNAKWLKNKIGEVRDVGSEGLDIKGHLQNSRSSMRKVVEEAYSHYPTEWIKDSMNKGTMAVKKVDRGYYGGDLIAISDYGGDTTLSTAFHELGHRFEDSRPGIKESEKEFYDRRTSGEILEWLGPGYAKSEITRKDKFIHPYMGKDYGGHFYELVSMGFEYAYTDPTKLAEDEDMESWIYGLLLLK